VAQAQHEAAAMVIGWALQQRAGTVAVGDPRGVLALAAGRRHNRRVRDWRVGHLIAAVADKAEQAGITVIPVDERGSSSTCPKCRKRVPKPSGRVFTCLLCGFTGHRDLVAAAHIAAALITAAPARPLAGRPAPPAPGRAGGQSLASPRGPRKHHQRTYGEVH
jgi:IS605 OrfB family transposase